ncbi:MAG: hypothetical protein WAJ93_17850 [Candidatus Nitrosopolaris sp.]
MMKYGMDGKEKEEWGTMRTLLDFENAVLDLFENNRITFEGAKTVLWTLLAAIYEDELIEEPHRRETIINNIERQKEQLLVNILPAGCQTNRIRLA